MSRRPGPDPVANAHRKQQRLERFGEHPTCIQCGYPNPAGLVAGNRAWLEAHHPLGVASASNVTIPVCRNCHAELTEGLRDEGVRMRAPTDPLLHAANTLFAFAVLFESLVPWLRKQAQRLIDEYEHQRRRDE